LAAQDLRPAQAGEHLLQVLASLEEELAQTRQRLLQETTLQDLLDQRNSLAQSQVMYFI
jgi:hypothetical protein